MLKILGSPKKLCDRISRRDMLWAGGLGLFGLGLGDFLALQAAQPDRTRATASSFGRAKACILLYLYGAASQLELADMKPDAPENVKGELRPIASSLPGVPVCECLPNMARAMDKVTVVRSMTHAYPIHGVAYAVTGIPKMELAMELNPRDGRHWPFVGSVIDYVHRRTSKPKSRHAVPDNIALPFPFSSHRVGEVPRAGPYAAYLGGSYNPIWTDFRGTGTRNVVKTLQDQRLDVADPYMGITPDSRFELSGATDLGADMTLDRLNQRRGLVDQFEQARKDLDRTSAGQSNDRYRQMAYSVLNSDGIRRALDLNREPMPFRESYGMTIFGQAALAARRLVEAGSRFVTVFWDEYGLAGSGWDTHWEHYPRMKNELLPGLDRAFSGLVQDLDARGMLDETLVLCITEHGRTPKLSSGRGGGRDHWSQAYTNLFAGGGVARGNVVGKTDAQGGTVKDRPVSPKDILATLYHLMGVDPHTELADRTGRPMPLIGDGAVVTEMLA
ncbi:MAG: DUF1501 domain-containing protein [Gemmataceae bacterium]|nr:DUF1501 domain-containing protein [Gemmataceae bacterium]